ncbi:exodeoxyribonuclease VII large subunit [Treponema sp.]|uniref:exodeoxyribonuclease VII large subunit n=1 Tax=Treponema sp. TaxID=166 RepID=UPI00298E69DB|nr:exodeoxyribonuclease VII large subunit [Treponema sp.]
MEMEQLIKPEQIVYTVSQINGVLKNMLQESFPCLTIEGEISNYRPNSTGHLYFSLKDDKCQINAVMFKFRASQLNFIPKDGMLVRCTGSLDVYEPRGTYSIVINTMELAGEGNILMMLEKRKRMLAQEGLFDESRKKPLPLFPKTVGVVTSATGAALRDIMQIIRRRNPVVSITIFPCIVQGADAAPSIANQIKTANRFKMCDVLIVGRGGGSLEDLLPFSEEIVVRSVASSEIPVISAVGHEIDWALCDFAADKRASTPSAAAEFCTPLKSDVISYLQNKQEEFYSAIKFRIENLKSTVKQFSLDNLENRFRTIEQPLLFRFDNAKEELLQNMSQRLKDTRVYIEKLADILEASSPKLILAKGYSMVRDRQTGKIIRGPSDTKLGAQIEIIPANGTIEASVTGL